MRINYFVSPLTAIHDDACGRLQHACTAITKMNNNNNKIIILIIIIIKKKK